MWQAGALTVAWVRVPSMLEKVSESKGLSCNSGHVEASRSCTRGETEDHRKNKAYKQTSVISNHYLSSSLYSNVTISTRINSSKCTYVHLCLSHCDTSNRSVLRILRITILRSVQYSTAMSSKKFKNKCQGSIICRFPIK